MTCFNDKIIAVTSGLVLLVIMVRHFAFESWGAGCPPNIILLVTAAIICVITRHDLYITYIITVTSR